MPENQITTANCAFLACYYITKPLQKPLCHKTGMGIDLSLFVQYLPSMASSVQTFPYR